MLLAIIASGSLRPALQPDGVPQSSPGPTGQWTLRPGGLNCYDGHGAPGASGSPHAEPITLDECKSACLAASGCQAIVVDVKKFEVSLRPPRPDAPAQSKLVSCFLREEVRPEECVSGTDFELYTLAPASSPASSPSPRAATTAHDVVWDLGDKRAWAKRSKRCSWLGTNCSRASGWSLDSRVVAAARPVPVAACPRGQRNAAESECLAAVQEATLARGLTLRDFPLKTVRDEWVPSGCSYSKLTHRVLFNKHPAGRRTSSYDQVCIEDLHLHAGDNVQHGLARATRACCSSLSEAWREPRTKHNRTVLVLGGMMNQRDLDRAGEMTQQAGADLVIYNNDAGDAAGCSNGTAPGEWCGQSCDQLRLPTNTLCTDVPNMGRSEASFFRYVYEHYDDLAGKQVVFSGSTVSAEYRDEIVPSLLNGPANGDVVPRCFLGEFHSQLSTWAVWSFGFTRKCAGQGKNDRWSSCEWCRPANESAQEGEAIDGTTFHEGPTPCKISYLDFDQQRPQVVCAARPNTVGAWLGEHAPSPGAKTDSPACYRGAFRSHGEALRKRSRDEYREIMNQLRLCSNPEASHFVERAALYLFASI